MKLFLIHCGFYDAEIGDGIFENHVDYFVIAETPDQARATAKTLPSFKNKRMHVDGIQEIEAVSGYRISLIKDASLNGESIVKNTRHRDLASAPVK